MAQGIAEERQLAQHRHAAQQTTHRAAQQPGQQRPLHERQTQQHQQGSGLGGHGWG
jgi:hypothetical protein